MKSYDDSDWCQIFAHWFKMVTIVAIVLVGFATPVSAQFGDGTFELDGDITVNKGYDDWENPATENAFSSTGLLTDGARETIFTGGGSKDIRDVSQWKWTTGSVPDKNDIRNAYAAAYNVNENLNIFLAGDRYSTDGSAQMGVWFFQEKVGMNGDGTFSGVHRKGDILMLAEFTEGGRAANVKVYEWDPAEKINLKLRFEGQGGVDYFATSNELDTPSWAGGSYTPKGGAAGDAYPPNAFFEGGINLSSVLGDNLPCFSTFLMETRSSHRANAQLKDFVLGDLNTCKLELANVCLSSVVNTDNYTSLLHTFEYNVTNSGFGAIEYVTFTDDIAEDVTGLDQTGILEKGASHTAEYSYTSIDNPPTNRIYATGHIGDSVTATVDATATCTKVEVSPMISVVKECRQTLEAKDGLLAVRVDYNGYVCNEQNGTKLTGVSLVDSTGYTKDVGDLYPANDPANDPVNRPQCVMFSAVYYPSSTPNTCAQNYMHSNTIVATGMGALNGVEATDMATATCNLCDGNCEEPSVDIQ